MQSDFLVIIALSDHSRFSAVVFLLADDCRQVELEIIFDFYELKLKPKALFNFVQKLINQFEFTLFLMYWNCADYLIE